MGEGVTSHKAFMRDRLPSWAESQTPRKNCHRKTHKTELTLPLDTFRPLWSTTPSIRSQNTDSLPPVGSFTRVLTVSMYRMAQAFGNINNSSDLRLGSFLDGSHLQFSQVSFHFYIALICNHLCTKIMILINLAYKETYKITSCYIGSNGRYQWRNYCSPTDSDH